MVLFSIFLLLNIDSSLFLPIDFQPCLNCTYQNILYSQFKSEYEKLQYVCDNFSEF